MLSSRPYERIGDADIKGLTFPGPPQLQKARRWPWVRALAIAVGTAALLVLMVLLHPHWATVGTDLILGAAGGGRSSFDWAGRYVLRDFDRATPMANFLPGLGGYWGELPLTFFLCHSVRYSCIALQGSRCGHST